MRAFPFPGRVLRTTVVVHGEFSPDGYSCAALLGIPLADSRQLVPAAPSMLRARCGCWVRVADPAQWDQGSVELLLIVLRSHWRERLRGVKESPLCNEITSPVFCGSSS